MSEKFILSYADYIIIGLLLLISASVGLFYLVFGKKQKTNDEYLLAGKDMSIAPVAFSLMATFMSATTLMGIPAEMYLFGTNMTFMNLGFILGPIIALFLFVPIYFNNGFSTPYEYLEKRFGKITRRILCIMYLIQNILFNGASLYAPALAISAVTNLSLWMSVLSIGLVCTFYCVLGGMKAVIWTDVFQSILMFVCLMSIIIKGCLDLGGIEAIFKTAYDGGRILLPTFKLDFSIRYTMWSIFLQGLIITTTYYSASQTQIQRQLTLRNIQRSNIASLLSIPMNVIFQLLCCFCGFIFYVYFLTCDPVTSHEHPITSYDQLMPYYIISTMKKYPGLPGLCIAGIFSATLSTISSGINSMAAVTYLDIIRPIWSNFKEDVLVTKIASVVYGVLSIAITFVIASMGNLVKATIIVNGTTTGPTLAVFLLASLTTTANEMGVNLGVVSAVILSTCITFIPNDRYYPPLPLRNECSDDLMNLPDQKNDVYLMTNSSNFHIKNTMSTSDLPDNFPVSYMWVSPLCLVVCFIVGYISSWIINYIRGTPKDVPLEYLSPFRQRFCAKDQDSRLNCSKEDRALNNIFTVKSSLKQRLENVLPLNEVKEK